MKIKYILAPLLYLVTYIGSTLIVLNLTKYSDIAYWVFITLIVCVVLFILVNIFLVWIEKNINLSVLTHLRYTIFCYVGIFFSIFVVYSIFGSVNTPGMDHGSALSRAFGVVIYGTFGIVALIGIITNIVYFSYKSTKIKSLKSDDVNL